MDFQDYYKILSVAPDADSKTIKTAYRKLARKYHPDVSEHHEAEEKFKQITPIIGINYKRFMFSYTYTKQTGDILFDEAGYNQITLGFNFGWTGWLVWALVLNFVIKVKHPPVFNFQPLDSTRMAIGYFSLLILIITFSASPFVISF